MNFNKEIYYKHTDEQTIQTIIQFWEKRGFTLTQISDSHITGKRGSLLGNLTAYSMQKLVATISILILNERIKVEIHVNTVFQYITKYNKLFFELELETFENVLLNNDHKEEEWEAFKKESQRSDALITIILLVVGCSIGFFFIFLFQEILKVRL